jgi:multicomponent Na+:H+ antiporter subunit A
MTVLLVAHAVVGIAILSMTGRLQRAAWWVGALPMLATLAYAGAYWNQVLDGRPVTEHIPWISGLDLAIDLRLDGFGLLMLLIVSGIGVAVMAYGSRYFSPSAAAARTAGLLVLFSGSMLGLVLADNLLFLFTCWELTSITSWLLIGTRNTDPAARSGALHALLVTSLGGLALLAGLVLLGQSAGTYLLSEIVAAPPGGATVTAALALILVGVVTKSAQFPTHAWLPGAMVAPTPVSAYLHSATMVKAGIYLAARLAPAFAVAGGWRQAVTTIGVVTMLLGGLRALRQNDLKLLLAMGTVSQLGFLLVLVGIGRPEATLAGIMLLSAHALFKGALFLVVGIVDHEAGTRDRRELAGFGEGWGAVKAVTLISAASMAGLPPLFGFIAKEGAYEAFAYDGFWGGVTLAGLVAGSILTVAYSARLAATILPRPRSAAASPPAPKPSFIAPAVVLTVLTLAGGIAAGIFEPIIDRAVGDLEPGIEAVSLSLWHGFNLPLALSAITVLLGVLLVAARQPVARIQAALTPPWGGEEAYAAAIRGLNTSARKLTGVVQNGSLPIYIAVILLTAVLLPGAVFLANASWPGWPDLADSPLQVVAATVVIGAALAAAAVRRRFAAVLTLGVVGYGMGLVFLVQGAPDLALVQFSIETLTIVLFMLVLRLLPDQFESRPTGRSIQGLRVLVSATVALVVFGFVLVTGTDRQTTPVATGLIERSLPEAEGRNVVNVILVDFRGLDTLGEVGVLVIAGLGIVALARIGRRGASQARNTDGSESLPGAPVEQGETVSREDA